MTVLALDIATKTGFAIRHNDGRLESGVENFKPGRKDGLGVRFCAFEHFLHETLSRAEGIDLVIYEVIRFRPARGGLRAIQVWAGFEAVLTGWCEYHNIPYRGVPPQVWKKAIVGNGAARKPAVIAAIRARGFNPVDDNEADAIAVLLHAELVKEGSAL